MLAYKVGNAETGDLFTVRMDPNDFSLNIFKSCLSTFSGISPNDQILLIGPPFKRLDSQFSPEMQDGEQQIFLYNRRFFSDTTPGPSETKLKPYAIPEPGPIDTPMSLSLVESLSPILRVIPDYERQYLGHIRRGEIFLAASEQCALSCKRCVEQMTVQLSALDGAVGNLSDHYASTQGSFQSAQAKLVVQQKNHRTLLDDFDKNLERLRRVPLHPSLLQRMSSLGESGTFMTLLDTVPVDQEHAWVDKCRQAHQKVEENLVQLQMVYEKVTASLRDIDGKNSIRVVDIAHLSSSVAAMDSDVASQKLAMRELRESYHAITERISAILEKVPVGSMTASGGDFALDDVTDVESTELVKALASGSRKQEGDVMQRMEHVCVKMMETKKQIEEAKTALVREVYRIMQQVATIQTDIQFKLKKGMDLMRKWRHGHNGYFQHLERMKALPEAYKDFLLEVIRRQKYTEEFEALVKESVDKIKGFRDLETQRREQFMTTCGSSLSPFFFDAVPSLVEKPPYFNATVTERQPLPEITIADVAALQELGVYAVDDIVAPTRNSGSLNSSLSSGGTGPDESTALDGAKNGGAGESTRGSADSASAPIENDRIKELERENQHLRRLLAAQQGGNEAMGEEPAASPVTHLLAQLGKDVYEVLTGIQSAHAVVPSGEPKSAPEDSGADIVQKSIDYRFSETIDVIEKLNMAVRRAQRGFNEHLGSLQLPNFDQIETITEFTDEVPTVTSAVSSSIASSAYMSVPTPPPTVTSTAAALSTPDSGPLIPVSPKISFLTFEVGDIALFLPTNKADVFLAFSHAKCPNRYLSQDSLVNFKSTGKNTPGYILGKIVFIETRIASGSDSHSGIGPEGSPLRLQEGTEYHLLEVEQVSFGSSKPSSRKRSSKSTGELASTPDLK